ncbi:UDP-Glycosyltransferase superfamily protein, putative [Theobroma cacao]|uniref:UDP-Glycosyltransferase superfamily protein, putative n=1 Tax=Theobroma cacao TaxID=3641 RepID=A0A061ES51_THECC|nr:UDP-Glycosyltransferase superfamily protein, putative [Theobroma cacao]
MSPGHLVPMIDMARLVATHGSKATVITTPRNISRFQTILNGDHQSGNLQINLLTLDFHFSAADLFETSENLDTLSSRHLSYNFSKAIMTLQPQADDLVSQYKPDAIISDQNIPWTAEIAQNYVIPGLVFHGTCCLNLSLLNGCS